MQRDQVTVAQVGMALRRVLMQRGFAKELCKITGADGFTFGTAERSTTNRVESVTHLSIDGVTFRIVIAPAGT